MSHYKRPESVLVVVYTQSSAVLLLERRDCQDFWQSVTGSLEAHEKPEHTALRELQEETGLAAAAGKLIDPHYQEWFDIYPQWQHRYQPGVVRNLEHIFAFELLSKPEIILSAEHRNYYWADKAQAIAQVRSPTNKAAIARFVP